MRRQTPSNRPGALRRRLLLAGWLAGALVVCVRAGEVQLVEGADWRAVAESQHTADKTIAAARGSILDRDGTPMAVSRESYQVGIAPRELAARTADVALLSKSLGVSRRTALRLTSPARKWSVVPGRYPPSVRDSLADVRGIYLERDMERFNPHGDLARGIIGVVTDGVGRGGIEQAYDDLLRGSPGREVVGRDNVGSPIPGDTYVVQEPITGGQVTLTLDLDLQEIARQALQDAVDKSRARGGDVLVTDPHTGEVLAAVSIMDGHTTGLGTINTPYEPGSILKPFTVAAELTYHTEALTDTVDVGDGTWTVAGRTLSDAEHDSGRMTVADALRISSNVGIAKSAQGLTPGEQYENLRDFGFGTPTGIEIPGEASGVLRTPDAWTAQSPASLAIGYEVSVTPLQMAMAYGALANGGLLMEPHLVKEVRDATGKVVERFHPRVVRRVVSESVAHAVSRVLVDVVQDGTGTKAQLGTFTMAGKTGTSRAYSPDGGYEGGHNASFVGFFPAKDPQLVVFVRLERPQGDYYGGAVAAPVTRATMEAVLAARRTPLDRAELLRSMKAQPSRDPAVVQFAARTVDQPTKAPTVTAPDDGGAPEADDDAPSRLPLPAVAGLPLRVAARRLHALGLEVWERGEGVIVGTVPGAGTYVTPGDTVRLRVRERSND
ncbi:MAG: PASTA domain-containing protein [Gemmatimonadetes bacterium]|nr:PASTA domain-containing protein [Gemmatimonadota bacterium]